MRAAVLHAYGETPVVEAFADPAASDGQSVVDVLAAGLNPIDLRIASGTLAARCPVLPSVAGAEGIGRTADGRRVYFSAPVAPYGSFAEQALIVTDDAVEVPDGVPDPDAVAYGIAGLAAWLALEHRAQVQAGETVLVLGASGTVGAIGVQAARLLGAGRVVAAARSQAGLARAAELGADATVRIEGDVEALSRAFREAAGGDVDVVLDPLWGAPASAALEALGFHGRLVQLGQSAGGQATFSSASVRFSELAILGHTNFASPPERRAAALRRMWTHAAAGELHVDCEIVALDAIADAWRRQAEGPGRKLVIVPAIG